MLISFEILSPKKNGIDTEETDFLQDMGTLFLRKRNRPTAVVLNLPQGESRELPFLKDSGHSRVWKKKNEEKGQGEHTEGERVGKTGPPFVGVTKTLQKKSRAGKGKKGHPRSVRNWGRKEEKAPRKRKGQKTSQTN